MKKLIQSNKRTKLRRRVTQLNRDDGIESSHTTRPNDTRYISDSCGPSPNRTCISCGIKEEGLNFKTPVPNNPKSFNNIFCADCIALHTKKELYKLAIPFYNSSHEPPEIEGGLSEEYRYRRSSKHKHHHR